LRMSGWCRSRLGPWVRHAVRRRPASSDTHPGPPASSTSTPGAAHRRSWDRHPHRSARGQGCHVLCLVDGRRVTRAPLSSWGRG
jgi:hypothetical protein